MPEPLVDFVVSFDTTGSMSSCIQDVRDKVGKVCHELFQNVPGLRIGMIAHGDYCDGDQVISVLNLTDNQQEIQDFIRNAPNTSGGDPDECYELVLHRARSIGWQAKSRVLLMIGDADPHEPEYPANVLRLDWKEELRALQGMRVRVYPLQCLAWAQDRFWPEVARLSETVHFHLEDFSAAAETIMGYVYMAAGDAIFQEHKADLPAGQASLLEKEARKYT